LHTKNAAFISQLKWASMWGACEWIERTRKGGGKRCGVGEKREYENFLIHLKEMRNEGVRDRKKDRREE